MYRSTRGWEDVGRELKSVEWGGKRSEESEPEAKVEGRAEEPKTGHGFYTVASLSEALVASITCVEEVHC